MNESPAICGAVCFTPKKTGVKWRERERGGGGREVGRKSILNIAGHSMVFQAHPFPGVFKTHRALFLFLPHSAQSLPA